MIVKSYTDILKEAVLSEDFDETALETNELKEKYNECVSEMVIIPEQYISYRAEMIPVFKNNSDYFVEFANVTKYMEAQKIKDIIEAMNDIAEANNIDFDDMSLVIESKEYMESIIESAIEKAKNGDTSLLESCELSMKLINMLKSEGVNVVCLGEGKLSELKEKLVASIKDTLRFYNPETNADQLMKNMIKAANKFAQKTTNTKKLEKLIEVQTNNLNIIIQNEKNFKKMSKEEKEKIIKMYDKRRIYGKSTHDESDVIRDYTDSKKCYNEIIKIYKSRLKELQS